MPRTVENNLGLAAVLELLQDRPEVGAAHRLESAHRQLVSVLLAVHTGRRLQKLLQPDQTCEMVGMWSKCCRISTLDDRHESGLFVRLAKETSTQNVTE